LAVKVVEGAGQQDRPEPPGELPEEGAKEPARASRPRDGGLTRREREIMALLAEGLSGRQIAERLVLSPETVRTHIRNAMAKLGASTRSQAVALALQREDIESGRRSREAGAARPGGSAPARGGGAVELAPTLRARGFEPVLRALVGGLVSLYEVDAGALFLVDEDGLALRRVALVTSRGADGIPAPESIGFGEGPVGRVALERRSNVVSSAASGPGALIASPMLAGDRLVGAICLATRASRPVAQSEVALLEAFANRVAEVLAEGTELTPRLRRTFERFRASWSAARPD
jgi:DNA-binding CsgD family transcriptional regulator